MKPYIFTIYLLLSLCLAAKSQPQSSVFGFTRFSESARTTALGQHTVALLDDDPVFALLNPAALPADLPLTGSVQHGFLPQGIQFGQAFAAGNWKAQQSQWIAGFSYSSHGDIIRADPFGNRQGTFEARSFSMHLGMSKQLYERLQVGARIEYLQGTLEQFQSNGLAAHLGMLYRNPEDGWTIGVSWNQIGWQWTPYAEQTEDLRSNLQVAFAKRLKYVPFRFSLTYHHLNRWNLLYDSPVGEENLLLSGQREEESNFSLFVDNLARHFAINGEIFIGKSENLRLRIGYDHQRRTELNIFYWNSFAGFSAGFGLQIQNIRFDYGWAAYHLAGGLHHLGLQYHFSPKEDKEKEPLNIL